MSWLDIAVIILLAGFAWYGFFFGFIRVLGNLIGLAIGTYIASHVYLPVYNWLTQFIPLGNSFGKIIIFIACFTVVSHLINWGFVLIEKAFDVVSIIPFLKTINHLAGLILALLEGIFILGIISYLFDRHLPNTMLISRWLADSSLAPQLVNISKFIVPFIPKLINRLQLLF